MAAYSSQAFESGDPIFGPKLQRRRFILCFDGTGNKFQGNEGDSNILKIYSMLDKTDGAQFHYYQPGIGTYTTRASLSSNSTISRLASWYNKAKDSAVGTTVDEHVMAGYKFLMRYYQTGDDIYFFGFSRGSYIARFLAEMLDHVGLLSAGNEELIRFVWKTFAKWQARQGGHSTEEKKKAAEMLRFMKAFRETFSRPVRRIRFLGLFDTVNSVSRFEGAWMQRSQKFPYTARSSALMIRHAVAIDERRAKFRQDLLSQKKTRSPTHIGQLGDSNLGATSNSQNKDMENGNTGVRFKNTTGNKLAVPGGSGPDRFRSRSRGRSRRKNGDSKSHAGSAQNSVSDMGEDSDDEDENALQDIEEVWFPGGHADIGGGWPPDEPEKLSLSHGPLVWMIREAQKSGLVFISEKMKELNCFYDEEANLQGRRGAVHLSAIPQIEVNDDILPNPEEPKDETSTDDPMVSEYHKNFLATLESSCTRGLIHDCLCFGQGLSAGAVITWKIMEYMPFRRMDLQKNGSWKAIRWPLPMGEVRDIPDDVKIHNSVIRRMKADPNYRPGNLIVGGGGRGVRRAPKSLGMGDWVVLREEGHPVGEVWVAGQKRPVREGEKEKIENMVEKDIPPKLTKELRIRALIVEEHPLMSDEFENFVQQKGAFTPLNMPDGVQRLAGMRLILQQNAKHPETFTPHYISLKPDMYVAMIEAPHLPYRAIESSSAVGPFFWAAFDHDERTPRLQIVYRKSDVRKKGMTRGWEVELSHEIKNSIATSFCNGTPGSDIVECIKHLKACALQIEHPMLLPTIIFSHEMSSKTDIKQRDARDWLRRLEHAISMRTGIADNESYVEEDGMVDYDLIGRHMAECHAQILWKRPKAYLQLLDGFQMIMNDFMAKLPTERNIPSLTKLHANMLSRIKFFRRNLHGLDSYAYVTLQRLDIQRHALDHIFAQRDSKLNIQIARLAHESKQDSSAQKTLALMGVVFFPGAYLASIFSMPFFNFQNANGGGCGSSINSSSDNSTPTLPQDNSNPAVISAKFWIYWAVTIPVTAIIVLIWYVWEKRRKRRNREGDDELEMNVESMELQIQSAMRKRTMSKIAVWENKRSGNL